ncbi:hypothetical protein MBEHAL_0347 [Halarchaeum acidiphilum MH1-52-1]|uniref:Uncharacterized protein n=1 Tax=Halarchaeum acidiphilum MH1-52-1 TaxID=1261545 RepID=U2YS58_9EURY|nr:hypothetical protein MBEHAL_0347 [Halarchaeum acidiphilum MH1-52-1]
MKRAGDVVRSAQGLAIVRCPDAEHPDIGAEVVNERLATWVASSTSSGRCRGRISP